MAHLLQVGVGSGGMPVLDMLCRDSRVHRITLIEPDEYKAHNVGRHLFPQGAVGQRKVDLAQRWLEERRPDLQVDALAWNLLDPDRQEALAKYAAAADLGVCAVDNEAAKFHWDALMRRAGKPWTLGEVLSGGIGGFVHWFVPGGPCYGCVASFLQRSVEVEKPKAPDYANPGGAVAETTVPAGIASIHAIAALHALVTLHLLEVASSPAQDLFKEIDSRLGFTSFLLTLQKVPEVFDEAMRPFRFRVPRLVGCLICQPHAAPGAAEVSSEDLDVALDQALARLGDG